MQAEVITPDLTHPLSQAGGQVLKRRLIDTNYTSRVHAISSRKRGTSNYESIGQDGYSIILIAFETPEKDDVRITVKILVWVGEMEAIEHLQSVIAGIRMR